MALKYNIYILPIVRHNKKGDVTTLHQRLYYAGSQWQHSLRISVPSDCYNNKAEKVTKGKDKDRINRMLDESKKILRDIFLRYELVEHKTPDIDAVVCEYLATIRATGLDSSHPNGACAFLDERIEEFISEQSNANNWVPATAKKFLSLKNALHDYDKRLRFDNLTDKQLYDFFDHLSEKRHNINTTLQKKASFLRWFLRWANKKGYYKGNSHETFRPRYKGGNFDLKAIIYLTEEELQKLEDCTFGRGEKHLEQVRDVFLFSCFSGLRHSDIMALTPSNIVDDTISITTRKTSDHLVINLNRHTRALLDKYKDWATLTGKCLPVISNQKTNDYLHDLCRKCGIDTPTTLTYFTREERHDVVVPKYEAISFHAARRTFITHALRLGIPVPVIMKFSGHHSTEMLKPYMQVVDELKQKEMAKFDMM